MIKKVVHVLKQIALKIIVIVLIIIKNVQFIANVKTAKINKKITTKKYNKLKTQILFKTFRHN